MNVKEKYRIVEKIIQSNDDSILEEVKDLLGIHDDSSDFWATLPDSVKQTIEESLNQIREGKVHANEEVMADIKRRFLKDQ
jgi:gas vesicle protein